MHRYIDLHMHTSSSDGTDSPNDLFNSAKETNIGVLAITDHNTLLSLPKANELAQSHSIRLINDVEVNCILNKQRYHILGLGINLALSFEKFVLGIRQKNLDNNRKLIKNMSIDYSSLSENEYYEYTHDRSKGGWKALTYLKINRL